MRTHSPTIRHCCYKLVTGAAVCRRMRRRGFDVKWAYLQGEGKFMGCKVWARAPFGCRLYDKRGVEYVWEVVKPLYGGPDSGRVWYLTFTSWLMSPAAGSFLRCDADACLFDRVLTDGRINLNLYVDDGSTWDSNAVECDKFYGLLARRFTITDDPGVFFLGMNHIDHHSGALTLCSRTYILNICQRGCLLLAGSTPHAVSRRQDCSAESSTAAELVSASTFVGDIAYGVNVLNFVGLEQGTIQMTSTTSRSVTLRRTTRLRTGQST